MESLSDLGLTELQLEIRNTCREIGEKKILPVREKYDAEGIFPTDIAKDFADAGLFGLFIPEEFGGMGGGTMDMVVAVEELSKYCAGIALSLFGTALGTLPILLCGSEEQKRKYLPRIAEGTIAAFALTEANAGSDAAGVRTTAVEDGDCYVLNGTKQWITNGGEADIYTVCAMTDPGRGARGASFFIVEKGTPGFTFGTKEKKMGIRGSATYELVFTDCRIPKENLLGKPGEGYKIAMDTLDGGRIGIAAQALGLAEGALQVTVDYVKTRKQFGKTLGQFQNTQFQLADMATRCDAAQLLVYRAAIDHDIPKKTSDGMTSSMAKLYAAETAMYVTTKAVQLHGGYGYIRDYDVERMMRDAKITEIYEGTSEVQRMVIAKNLLK